MTGRGLRRAGGPGLAGAAVTALLACSVSIGSGGLNATKLQDAIRDRIQQATGVAPDSVTCPDDAKQGKGNDFQCAAVVEGQSVPFDVTQTDDSGRVTFAAAVAMLQRTAVERVIQTDVQKKGAHPVTANCGRTAIVVAKVGSTFSCVLDAGDGPQTAASSRCTAPTAGSASDTRLRVPRPGRRPERPQTLRPAHPRRTSPGARPGADRGTRCALRCDPEQPV